MMRFSIPLWSFGLSCIWKVDMLVISAFVTYYYGVFVGAIFVTYAAVDADKQSYKFYHDSVVTEYDEVILTMESCQLWYLRG